MEVGTRIRLERERHGWDQVELARRLGDVGQQTVSRWERGGSRPRREMVARLAGLFDVPVRDLLVAAGYAATADRRPGVRRPVRPRLVNLPLADLTSEQFEHFVTDLAQMLYPAAHVSRYGTQGHTQGGVDVLVQEGQTIRATLQCKRHRTFGPQQVREAVAALTLTAEQHFLVLSRPASPGARQEMAKHPGWTLFDAEDLSRIVRNQLSRDHGIRLVDTHFPGWREPLLGVSEPGVWQTTEEFFRLSSRGDFYSHSWDLVGRQTVCDEATAFADTAGGGVALLLGRGGIGKTRVLRSIAEGAEARGGVVRFLATAGTVQPQQFETLPDAPKLLVLIDDVHDRLDVAELVSGIWRNRPGAKVILSLRPYGLNQLNSQLRHVGLHGSTLPIWRLADLSVAEAEVLARQVLGSDGADAVIRRLARLTTDCPLITVVGAVLIKRGLLDPNRLESDDSIRTEILRAFRDALVADPVDGDPGLRRGVLEAVALLQPFRMDDESFQTALSELTQAPFDRAVSHLRALEDAGVLLRRGNTLRIIPDLLGDVILAGAVFDDRSGISTGYVERARAAASGAPLQNVFLNASRVDWQINRDRNGRSPTLAAPLWHDVEEELKAAGIRGRDALLGVLKRVAYYQPDYALPLVRWTIDNPTDVVEELEGLFGAFYTPSYDRVLEQLPPILKVIAYNFDYFVPAVDMLWELSHGDTRPTHQNPDHAIRVLQDLASYEPGKPLVYNAAMIDAAERWIADAAAREWAHSPFDVLEQLLATEGSEDSFDGRAVSFRPFAISVESTAPVRQRVIELALREAGTADVKRAARAVRAVESALRYPSGLFGRPVPDEETAKWTPQFIELIKALGGVVTRPDIDPALGVAVRKALNWHAEYSKHGTRDVARQVLARIPRSIPFEIALLLHDGWGHLVVGRWTDHAKMQVEKQARLDAVTDKVLKTLADDEILNLLSERLRVERHAFGQTAGHPGPFCGSLFAKRPELGVGVCRRVLADPTSILVQVLSFAIAQVGETFPDDLIPTIDDLVATGSVEIRWAVARGLGWYRGRRALVEGELDRLFVFAADDDASVRIAAVRAAQVLAETHPNEAMQVVTAVRFEDEPLVAEEVCSTLGEHGFLTWQGLSEEQRALLTEQLVRCPSIEDYHLTTFLAEVSGNDPVRVVDLLTRRVEHAEEAGESAREYRPLPFHWDSSLRIGGQPESLFLLRQVRDWIAGKPEDWQRREYGGDLFAALAQQYDDGVLAVLEEAMHSGSRKQIQALAAILKKAPRSFVWDKPEFVARALTTAAQFGDEAVRDVGGALHASVISGSRVGTPGQPYKEDLEQRDKSAAIADQLPAGSMEQRFYRSLQASAEQSINWSTERDELLDDRRDW